MQLLPRELFARFLMHQMAIVGKKEMEATSKIR